jgi:hypothetical protein
MIVNLYVENMATDEVTNPFGKQFETSLSMLIGIRNETSKLGSYDESVSPKRF